MPDNPTTALVKTSQLPALARVSSQLALTDKLLTKPEEPFLIPYRKGNKWGFCDRNKNIVIDCVYNVVNLFSEGLAAVHMPKLNGVWGTERGGFIDIKGDNVISMTFNAVSSFSEGLAAVKKEGLWGYIDKLGQIIIPHNYIFADDFLGGLAKVGMWSQMEFTPDKGVIDKSGNELIPLEYQYISNLDDDIIYLFKKIKLPHNEDIFGVGPTRKEYYLFDKHKSLFTPLLYDEVSTFYEGVTTGKKQGKWIIIDRIGKVSIYLNKNYNNIQPFSEGLAAINLDGKWGFMNQAGQEVVPLIYKRVYTFSEGLAQVQILNEWNYINKNGETVIETLYDEVSHFSENTAAFRYREKWGFINKLGQIVIEPKYDSAREFSSGLSLIYLDKEPGYIGKNGVEYWED